MEKPYAFMFFYQSKERLSYQEIEENHPTFSKIQRKAEVNCTLVLIFAQDSLLS